MTRPTTEEIVPLRRTVTYTRRYHGLGRGQKVRIRTNDDDKVVGLEYVKKIPRVIESAYVPPPQTLYISGQMHCGMFQ